MITVYGMQVSGNCYKLKLLLEQLGTPYHWIEIDSAHGATRTTEFLAMNPNGKVPILKLEDGRILAESNAILGYLAEGSRLLPEDRWQRALVMQWLFFEQYSHEPYIAVARFICLILSKDHPRRAELPRLHERGHQALAVMEQHLQDHAYLVGDTWSIADIALFAYTHVASEEVLTSLAIRRSTHGSSGCGRNLGLWRWVARQYRASNHRQHAWQRLQ